MKSKVKHYAFIVCIWEGAAPAGASSLQAFKAWPGCFAQATTAGHMEARQSFELSASS